MKKALIAAAISWFFLATTQQGFAQQAEERETVTRDGITYHELPFAAVQLSAIWETRNIDVCWEETPAEFKRLRAKVRSAVAETWEKNSAVRFLGWDKCKTDSKGVRIRIAEEGPRVESLGCYLDERPGGVTLNFTFRSFAKNRCGSSIDDCVRITAVHEFGHVLGFAHEQNRNDAPPECKKERAGTVPDWKSPEYDPYSVMNYCNGKKEWLGNGNLTANDIKWVQEFYGKPEEKN